MSRTAGGGEKELRRNRLNAKGSKEIRGELVRNVSKGKTRTPWRFGDQGTGVKSESSSQKEGAGIKVLSPQQPKSKKNVSFKKKLMIKGLGPISKKKLPGAKENQYRGKWKEGERVGVCLEIIFKSS